MESRAASLAAFSVGDEPSRRDAALSIRLSAAIVTASVDEPRVLTVRIGRDRDSLAGEIELEKAIAAAG